MKLTQNYVLLKASSSAPAFLDAASSLTTPAAPDAAVVPAGSSGSTAEVNGRIDLAYSRERLIETELPHGEL